MIVALNFFVPLVFMKRNISNTNETGKQNQKDIANTGIDKYQLSFLITCRLMRIINNDLGIIVAFYHSISILSIVMVTCLYFFIYGFFIIRQFISTLKAHIIII